VARNEYHVEIQTADEADAGTNADISVQFFTKNGFSTKTQLLDQTGHDDFERNSNDLYSFQDVGLPTGDELVSVTITHSGTNAWKMAWLKVSIGGQTWKAVSDKWFRNETRNLRLVPAVGRPNWMSTLSKSTTIDQINIPGTHDSGTGYLKSSNYHNTQALSIKQQLLLGIRYFDMRLRCLVNPSWIDSQPPADNANFTVHHENDWCYLYLDKNSWIAPEDQKTVKGFVLDDFLTFLDEYQSEFVLMQVQREYNTEPGFNDVFQELIARHDPSKFLITNTYPTYDDAKGKIVILNMNDALTNYGIPLQGPKLLNTPTLYIENHWMDSNKELKWGKVETALKVALQQNSGQWVITFVSDGSGAMHPRDFAGYLNQWVEDFIKNNGDHQHYGTVLVDFPTRSLVGTLLAKYLQ